MAKSLGATSEKVSNHIHEDLSLSILSKLPLKSLKRFGCVNKKWALLFENPRFMSMFRRNFISNCHSYDNDTSLLLHQELHTYGHSRDHCSLYSLSGERFKSVIKLDLPNPFQEEEPLFYILNSGINGTLCLYRHDKIVLWNPTIDEFNVIPINSIEYVPPYPGTFFQLHGFGYDHVRDDYKIIREVTFLPLTFWEIYSLKCNSWTKLDVNMPSCCFAAGPGERLYMDGICHWLSESENETNDERCLVSYDLSNNVNFTTLIPLAILSDANFLFDANFDSEFLLGRLVVLNGSIAIISYLASISSPSDMPTFHISILGELGVNDSWTKLFIIGPLSYISHPIGAGKNGDIFFEKIDGKVVCFNLSTQIIEVLGIKEAYSNNIVLCEKRLLSIGGINP